MTNLHETVSLFTQLGGNLILSPESFAQKLSHIKAFVFDWDGVFNTGTKGENLPSTFSEPDSMGTNMLRYGYWRANGETLPTMAILTGAHNPVSHAFAQREHFHAVFMRFKYKVEAVEQFMDTYGLQWSEVSYCFDDIIDLSVAEQCGMRVLVRREANPLFLQYVRENDLCDYITAQPGGSYAVREVCELFLGIMGNYESTITGRIHYSQEYKRYLKQRNQTEPMLFTPDS